MVHEKILEAEKNPEKQFLECQGCTKSFTKKGDYMKHTVSCCNFERRHLKNRQQSSYDCKICSRNFETRWKMKRHIFEVHNEIEVQTKYGRSLEKVVGDHDLDKRRTIMFNKLKADGLDDFFKEKLDS